MRLIGVDGPVVVTPVVGLMMSSHQTLVDYMTPLGLVHIMGTDHHYGPAPWVNNLERAEWTPFYYHKADGQGVGTITNLQFLARALEQTSKANILSTPNLLTLDNEEARIIVGQNVPFITGQFTTAVSATVNPFQTIERRDVGHGADLGR